MVDPIGSYFQSLTYSYAQQYAYDPSSSADYNYRVQDADNGGKTYHMVHIPNDANGSMYQYTVTVTNPATNQVQILESTKDGVANTSNGTIVAHNGSAFMVNANIGNKSIEWVFSNSPIYDGSVTVYPNSSTQAGTFTPACYVGGSHILTTRGEVPVEDLRIGDVAVTADGKQQPIVWIGHRETDPARMPHPETFCPVRIRAHAFGEALPHRDLRLSRHHCVFVDGMLIPILHLINGATIVDEPADPIVYYHVELAEHAILLAEGLPAESYLDVGNRASFGNGGAVVALHPVFAAQTAAERACAPTSDGGAELDGLRERLVTRAKELGFATTEDAAPNLLLDGRTIEPVRCEPDVVVFRVPAGHWQDVRLSSRAAPPAWTRGSSDFRRLGLLITRLEIRGDHADLTISPHAEMFDEGFHDREAAAGRSWRWTDGEARLPAALFAAFPEGCELTLRTRPEMSYWQTERGSRPLADRLAGIGEESEAA